MTEPHGTEAKANFDKAAQLVKEGKIDEARAVNLARSDRELIERRIVAAQETMGKST